MDELNSSFGRLSTSAAEWKPGGSDLQAAAVKEFVPGQGWAATPTPPTSPQRTGVCIAFMRMRVANSYYTA